MTDETTQQTQTRRLYRAVWRWHFYAGVFCIPLVIWLACTGSIYLFKPQIERWLDRPYDHLAVSQHRATPEQITEAALAAVPHSMLHSYELPAASDSSVRVLAGAGHDEFRVYINPYTLGVLHVVNEEKRPMRVLQHLHGELLAGDWGSRVVELAASWAIVLVVSGLFLWWPRETEKLAGVLWIRFGKGRRIFWRDLHAVTGVWVSAFALFLLLTGLPWAKGWGAYFKNVRAITGTAVKKQDWTTGSSSERAERAAQHAQRMDAMASEHAGHSMANMPDMDMSNMPGMDMTADYHALNVLVPAAEHLRLAYPVLVQPATQADGPWTVKSDSQNRPLRTTVLINMQTGAVEHREEFSQRHIIDRVLGFGIAAHEGQLFGLANQLLGLLTAMGLVTLCVSASALWWRRRHVGVLGAPLPTQKPRWTFALVTFVLALALYLPAMAVSLVTVLLTEHLVLRRSAMISRWLGLTA